MADDTDQNLHHTTTPLGGSAHRREARRALLRQWSGYVALVRVCPHCQAENEESNLFCTECATSLADVQASPAESSRAGLLHLQRRLAREELARRRHRPDADRGGSGWLISGVVLLTIAIVTAMGLWITLALWMAGIASSIWGLWQLRSDTAALRGWGIAFAAAGCGLIALVGSRSLATSSDAEMPPLPALATPGATPPATAVARATSAGFAPVAMLGADPAHTGQQPGPPPMQNPRLAWRFDAGSEVYGTPALADGVLFITNKSGDLIAVDAASGQQLWRRGLSDYVVRSSPAVVDGVVYVGGGFNLYAVDASTGRLRWKVPLRYAGQSAPTVQGDLVIVASQEGWTYGISTATGKMVWRTPADGLIFGAPAVADGRVLVGTDAGNVYSLDIEDGSIAWRAKVDGAIFASLSVAGDDVIVPATTGRLVALALKGGLTRWEADLGGDRAVAVLGNAGRGTGGSVIVTANDGGVYALSLADGAQQWLHPSGNPESGPATTSGDAVILGSGQRLIGLDGETGTPIWTYLAGDTISTAPTVSGGYVFFGAEDGFLYAVTDG